MKLFLKTKCEKTLKYFVGINPELAMLVIGNKKTLFISSLEEKPKGNFIVKDLKLDEVFKTIKGASHLELNFKEISKKNYDLIKKKFKGKITDCSEEIEKYREVKTRWELSKIKKAINITEKIFLEMFKTKFKTEFEIHQFLLSKCCEYGVKPSFNPCVASGNNSVNPHYFPKKHSPIKKGFCIVDFGVEYDGYCSDITRMLYFGKPNKKELADYNKVLKCIERLEKEVKAGSVKVEPDFKMIHAIGHGIGLDIHERPYVGRDQLRIGSVITLEPGIYDKYGIRIEDDYLVGKKGLTRLSKLSRDLVIKS